MPDDREDFEQAWARIVEDLTSGDAADEADDAVADGPDRGPDRDPDRGSEGGAADGVGTDSGTDPGAGLAALFEPMRRARSRQQPDRPPSEAADDPGAFVDNWEDEGHFVPPPPPEIPAGTPAKRLAWVGLLGGPLTLALIALTGWDAPRIVGIAAGLATLAGFVTLVWLLPESREDGGWDDGARL